MPQVFNYARNAAHTARPARTTGPIVVAAVLVLAAAGAAAGYYALSGDTRKAEACQANLRTIGKALKAYQQEHQANPDDLQALVSAGRLAAQDLICPSEKATPYIYYSGIPRGDTNVIVHHMCKAHRRKTPVLRGDGSTVLLSTRDVVQAIEESVRVSSATLAERIASSEDLGEREAASGSIFDGAVKSMDALISKTKGEERVALTSMRDELARLGQKQRMYMKALGEFQTAGSVDPAQIVNSEKAAASRAALDRAIKLQRDLSSTLQGIPSAVESRLKGADVARAKATSMSRRLAADMNLSVSGQIQESESQILQAYRDMLTVLIDHPDDWAVEDGSFMFQKDELLEEYNRHFAASEEAAQRQTDLQQSLLQNMRGRG